MYEKEFKNRFESIGIKVGKSQSYTSQTFDEDTGLQKQMNAFDEYNAPANNSNNDYYNEQLFGVPKETYKTYTQYQNHNKNFLDKFNVSININLFFLFCIVIAIFIFFIIGKNNLRKLLSFWYFCFLHIVAVFYFIFLIPIFLIFIIPALFINLLEFEKIFQNLQDNISKFIQNKIKEIEEKEKYILNKDIYLRCEQGEMCLKLKNHSWKNQIIQSILLLMIVILLVVFYFKNYA